MYSPPLAALPAASAPAREAKGTDMRKERLFITHLKRAEVFHNSTLSFQRRKLWIRHFGFRIQRVPGVLSCHSWVGKADSGESRRLGLGWSVLERLSWRWALWSGIGARIGENQQHLAEAMKAGIALYERQTPLRSRRHYSTNRISPNRSGA